MKQRSENGTGGKPGKNVLMATLLTAGLALTAAAQAEAHPGNLPPPRCSTPAPPVAYRQPVVQQVRMPPPPPRHDYRPAPPHHDYRPIPPPKHHWYTWPWWRR